MTSQAKISVVIPAYNEAHILPSHLTRLVPILEQVASSHWELFVVDDGSTDDTARVVSSLGLPSQVQVLGGELNRGKGSAIRRGVAATTGDMVLTCDADMATPPETLQTFIEALHGGVDVVIGNRRSPEARIERQQRWLRRTLGLVYLNLCRLLTRVDLHDYNCGFKLFRGELAREIMAASETDGWVIDMESLALIARRKGRIVELPVVWHDGERTAVRLRRDIVMTLWGMLKVWRRLRRDDRAVLKT